MLQSSVKDATLREKIQHSRNNPPAVAARNQQAVNRKKPETQKKHRSPVPQGGAKNYSSSS
jgi:hypothetical protein